jgi:glycerate-2-kinase
MGFIQNYSQLAKTPERKIVLDLIEAAFTSIQPDHVLKNHFTLSMNTLTIQNQTFDLSSFNRIFLVGIGKGSAGISKIIEEKLGERLIDGYVIDTVKQEFSKIQ